MWVGLKPTERLQAEPWLSTLGQRNMTKENALWSGGRSLSTKDLTEPTLSEMSGNACRLNRSLQHLPAR